MEVAFHVMIDKLKSGVWKRATTKYWQDNHGQYVDLVYHHDRMKLRLHEGHDRVVFWTINVNDSLNMQFMELKL